MHYDQPRHHHHYEPDNVEERTLDRRTPEMLFSQTLRTKIPDQELDATVETVVGYDKLTGKRVLITQHAYGTMGGEPISMKTIQELVSKDVSSARDETQGITFAELLSNPDQYNGKDVLLEGFYFHGFETIVLSERLEYAGLAEEHLWPNGKIGLDRGQRNTSRGLRPALGTGVDRAHRTLW